MKVASKINSLMFDLENELHKGTRDLIELDIIRVTGLIPKEVELIKIGNELRKHTHSITQGITVDYDLVHKTKDKFDELKKEINEGIK